MLGNVERIERHLEQVRSLLQTLSRNERAREAAKMKSPYEEDHDVPMHGDVMKPQYGMTEANTRLRVGSIIRDQKKKVSHVDSVRLPLTNVIVATELTHPNGDGVLMEQGRCAMRAAYVMPNSRSNSLKRGQST